jgi:GNAT superfamily N-acetyltransferase
VSTEASLVRLSDLNLAEANREQARWFPPSRLEEQDDVLFAASGTRFPGGPFNSVIGLGVEGPDAVRTLDAARAWYAGLGRGFTVFVRAHIDGELGNACARSGFPQMSDSPGMVLTERPEARVLSSGVVVRDVRSAEGAASFVSVVAPAFESIGMPPDMTRKVFSQPGRWLAPHLHVEVLYDHDEPVSAAMLLFSHGIAGVYWVGTRPAARGRGHAGELMRSISNAAFDRGARAVVLQATPFGEPVYRRLGYREVTRYPWYLVARGAGT